MKTNTATKLKAVSAKTVTPKTAPRIRRKLPPVVDWLSFPTTPDLGFVRIAQPNGMVAFMAVTYSGMMAKTSLFPRTFWTLEEALAYQREVFNGRQQLKSFELEERIKEKING